MAIKQKHKRNNRKLIRFSLLAAAAVAVGAWVLLNLQKKVFSPNVNLEGEKTASFYIPTGASYEEVMGLLNVSGFLERPEDFDWLAQKKDYPDNIKPGHYILKNGMNNNELVNVFRGGLQTPVKLTFSNVRTKQDLSGKVAEYIEADSVSILQALNDTTLLKEFGVTPETVYAMVLPNTYEIWWNTDAEGFIKRMHREYQNFWTEERIQKAKAANLNPVGTATLASIVDEETVRGSEKPTIAGLYLNRLQRGIRLQADPTIKFVLGDFAIKRVLSRDLVIDSPYNTYMYKGLPPGPIRFPSISGIQAVLNHEHHDYLYMCAKDDFSGYHNFAKTLRQHNVNAAKYRRALRERRIWR
ncbi:endolytic transglycosylase MltG [Marinilabilia rubra]|uniref:Endolytic murein transglycosylase n=1 Tax=Marinilabilia rubra TaxID=2162893 RepID=A0A2U2BAE6_9BACT|nr:endolytic transglycosylase MltG [Marinilabilia rubra]PWE00040.1 endolytic transglycosylase MltG [Marinilabilia rubra]